MEDVCKKMRAYITNELEVHPTNGVDAKEVIENGIVLQFIDVY